MVTDLIPPVRDRFSQVLRYVPTPVAVVTAATPAGVGGRAVGNHVLVLGG